MALLVKESPAQFARSVWAWFGVAGIGIWCAANYSLFWQCASGAHYSGGIGRHGAPPELERFPITRFRATGLDWPDFL
jgi:hypothetical protein